LLKNDTTFARDQLISFMRINPVKKKLIYHYSKFAAYNRILKINLDNGIKYKFRARTDDRTVIKEVWAREIYTKHGFNICENDTVFDLGGHIGVFAVLAGDKAKNGKVMTFEPMSHNFEMLKMNIELNNLNNVFPHNLAIASENGNRTFHLSSHEANKKVGYSTGGHSLYPSDDRDEKIQVKTATLESMIEKYNIDQIDYLKLDTEGAEFEILFNTPKEIIRKIRKIVMELHPFSGNTEDKMLNFLEDHGFENIIDKYGGNEYMVYSNRVN